MQKRTHKGRLKKCKKRRTRKKNTGRGEGVTDSVTTTTFPFSLKKEIRLPQLAYPHTHPPPTPTQQYSAGRGNKGHRLNITEPQQPPQQPHAHTATHTEIVKGHPDNIDNIEITISGHYESNGSPRKGTVEYWIRLNEINSDVCMYTLIIYCIS